MGFDKDIGRQFQKHDLERLGIFVEMPYLHGERYSFPKPDYRKGPTILPTGRKLKSGTQAGYFDKEYKRLYQGEAIARRKPIPSPANPPFLLGARTKKHSTPGDYYGTFSKCEAFSRVARPRRARSPALIGFLSRNTKKGGPGDVDICINKYPEHQSDRYGAKKESKPYGAQLAGPFVTALYPKPYFNDKPYLETADGAAGPCYIKKHTFHKDFLAGTWNPIGPTKWQGGSHGGCLNPFPEFMPCKYISMAEATVPFITSQGPIFNPVYTAEKTMFTTSVMGHNEKFRVNTSNYKTAQPTYTKYLLN